MSTPLRIFTARYSNPNIVRSGLVPIGITRYPPRFSLLFDLKANLFDLAPTSVMLAKAKAGLSPRLFAEEYEARLATLSAPKIVTTLQCLQDDASGVALLCYEDLTSGGSCHRTILADWLMRKTGVAVLELIDPGKKGLKRPVGSARETSAL